jgi:ATP-dependent helicase/nuclease subunit B
MREVLETPGRTAALVTPDRQLAEAVIAALQRWRIEVDDSAGRPLSACPVGGFLQSMVTMVAEAFAPVPTLAFLKHPLVAGGWHRPGSGPSSGAGTGGLARVPAGRGA